MPARKKTVKKEKLPTKKELERNRKRILKDIDDINRLAEQYLTSLIELSKHHPAHFRRVEQHVLKVAHRMDAINNHVARGLK